MSQSDEYVVRVSTLGRPFQDPFPLEQYPNADPGPTTAELAWNYKVAWEFHNQGLDPIAEVIHVSSGRIIPDYLGIKSFASLMSLMSSKLETEMEALDAKNAEKASNST